MTVVLIDDEPQARKLLRQILEEFCPEVKHIHEAEDLPQGIKLIRKVQPKLIFLDVEMPEYNGTEILDFFPDKNINFQIVFTTAYSEYAIKAFEINALDYILKPLRPGDVKKAVKKTQELDSQVNLQNKLEELRNSLLEGNFQKIGLPVNDGILFIPIDELIHMEADGMYTKVFTQNNGSQMISKPLKFFDHIVENENNTFYRPHRSHIINLKYLKQYVRKDGSYIVLENDQIIPIANSKKNEFLTLVSSL